MRGVLTSLIILTILKVLHKLLLRLSATFLLLLRQILLLHLRLYWLVWLLSIRRKPTLSLLKLRRNFYRLILLENLLLWSQLLSFGRSLLEKIYAQVLPLVLHVIVLGVLRVLGIIPLLHLLMLLVLGIAIKDRLRILSQPILVSKVLGRISWNPFLLNLCCRLDLRLIFGGILNYLLLILSKSVSLICCNLLLRRL